jgi:hypothetical protein
MGASRMWKRKCDVMGGLLPRMIYDFLHHMYCWVWLGL